MRWVPVGALVLAEIAYPLVTGLGRARLVVLTVLLGYVASLTHALVTRGWRTAAVLVAVTTGGGFAVEALGVATGFPFGTYTYGDALGPRLLGVPLVIPLAWTWMAWPAWLVANGRVVLAGWALAAWDLFLDPQMVAEGYWRWAHPRPALPGIDTVPVTNFVAWFAVGVLLMAALSAARVGARHDADMPMRALYVWTFASSVLAHAVFLGLPGSAVWGGIGMGAVVLAVRWR